MEDKVNSVPKDFLMEIPVNLAPKPEEKILDTQEQLEQSADNTAILFKKLHPEFMYRVDRLSNKSLRRVLKAAFSLPLEDAKLNLKHDDEREAFMIAMNLRDAMNYMMLYTKYKQAEDASRIPSQDNSSTDPSEENTDLLSSQQAKPSTEQVSSNTEENVNNNMENPDNGKETQ